MMMMMMMMMMGEEPFHSWSWEEERESMTEKWESMKILYYQRG